MKRRKQVTDRKEIFNIFCNRLFSLKLQAKEKQFFSSKYSVQCRATTVAGKSKYCTRQMLSNNVVRCNRGLRDTN